MKFIVSGADRETGTEKEITVECNSPADAIRICNAKGILVSKVEIQPETTIDKDPVADKNSPNLLQKLQKQLLRIDIMNGVALLVVFILCALPVAGGFAIIDFSSQLPCMLVFGIPIGIALIAVGVMIFATFSGMVDLPAPPEPPCNPAMICPHCQSQGTVHTEKIQMKQGVSGGKATAAILTGGISLLGTGLSRKEQKTKATCKRCGSTWHF